MPIVIKPENTIDTCAVAQGSVPTLEVENKAECRGEDVIRQPEPQHSDPFYGILDEMRALHDRKRADYGRGQDPMANLRASERFGVPPWLGGIIRLNDKISRIQSFVANGRLVNESLEDSMLDIAVYAILSLALYRETK